MGFSSEVAAMRKRKISIWFIGFSFSFVELFACLFLSLNSAHFSWEQLLPLVFGALWSVALAGFLQMFPWKAARVIYAVLYLIAVVYVGFQTGYYIMFSEMMWLTEFKYASEGSDYASVLLNYPVSWWVGMVVLILAGVLAVWKFPTWKSSWKRTVICAGAAVVISVAALNLPKLAYSQDGEEQRTDYKRAQSIEAVYEDMFNAHRLYKVCGLYQTLAKDIYVHHIAPLTPSYVAKQKSAHEEIDQYFSQRGSSGKNAMTGILQGKNVVLVLMESLDDWMVGDSTPTIRQLMAEGIQFTRFYTPVYGGIRTFNSEFCVNTGSFLSSSGGYAFDYVTNSFRQSLPNLLRQEGYSAITFHFNSPSFYSRGEFSPAMGYDSYIWYAEYMDWSSEEASQNSEKRLDTDDLLLFDMKGLNDLFFREGGPTLNFIISNAAHLPYTYENKSSQFGFEKYPEYYGMTGNEETDCALVKAKLLDDLFARLLQELEAHGQLDNTVIIGVTDHYTYGYKDEASLFALSGVDDALLLEKTPCFIWSADLQPMKVDKTLNTSDLLPTMLNLLGVDSPYDYIGRDAFDPTYEGYALFSDGSWISGDIAYDAGTKRVLSITGGEAEASSETLDAMAQKVQQFVRINNLILDTDYYKDNTAAN